MFLRANPDLRLVHCQRLMRLLEDQTKFLTLLRNHNNQLVSLRMQLFEAARNGMTTNQKQSFSFKSEILRRWGLPVNQTEVQASNADE